MNPTVTGALIGVGGTTVVGVAGFGATIWANRRNIRAAHDNRIWDKRAQVYVDTIAAVHHRQIGRQHDLRTYRMDEETERRAAAYLSSYTPPDWYDLEGRLMAFGSHLVIAIVQASSKGHMDAVSAYQAWSDATEAAKAEPGPLPVGTGERNRELRAAVQAACDTADKADETLIELIRAELQGKRRTRRQLAHPQALPPDRPPR